MNVRKPVDYSAMVTALDVLMTAALPQMELYYEIGRLINSRPEKGAAVAAAEYPGGASVRLVQVNAAGEDQVKRSPGSRSRLSR